MSLEEFRGECWLFRKLMQDAQADIDNGSAQAAKVLYQKADPRKTSISRFVATHLRKASGWRSRLT